MAQDLRKLFENDHKVSNDKMPAGHEKRFIERLDNQLPKGSSSVFRMNFMQIAASVVLMIALSYAAFQFFKGEGELPNSNEVVEQTKSIEDVSPELKKVEDYYLASINSELAKIEFTPETKELFDGYINRLDELTKEYERISKEIIEDGPNDNTVNALIDNLKLRLELLYRLKEKLQDVNTSEYANSQA